MSAVSHIRTYTVLLAALAVLLIAPRVAAAAPAAPAGLTAMGADGKVTLAWQPVSGATGYSVYSGASPSTITTLVSPAGLTATTADVTATNGTALYYAVKATASSGTSPASAAVKATAVSRPCSGTNAIVAENCYPGSAGWKLTDLTGARADGIEGYATKTSIKPGDSVDLKVSAPTDKPYRIDVYRTGYYGGTEGRLYSSLTGRTGVQQDFCASAGDSSGFLDCSAWSTTDTLTTTTAWPSGVYLLHLVREDVSADNYILLTIRDDSRVSRAVYVVPTSTYEAYNNYGGKSLYDFNSSGATTVAGTTRAVRVSYDRPYTPNQRDWYTNTDIEAVSWFERFGYDVSYATSDDLARGIPNLNQRGALISGAHDEYWSSEMRSNATAARDAGVGLAFLGGNEVYWRIRWGANAAGTQFRTQTTYKSTQGGAVDPVSPTGTWRDPAGINNPENGLTGIMYVGDNDQNFFPLVVSAAQGQNRFWRYTPLSTQAAGSSTSIGSTLVGWEWDSRVSNGREPAGLTTVAASPVTGELIQNNGANYLPGSATQMTTVYKAASGAYVWATGTNHWGRGLGDNMAGKGEPDGRIMQATVNVLADMNTMPTTPAAGISLDGAGSPAVVSTSPADGATGVAPQVNPKVTFDRQLDPATVTTSNLTLTGPFNTTVAATVSVDNATNSATISPTGSLEPFTSYTASIGTGIKGWSASSSVPASSWTFTTGAGTPPAVSTRAPASGATGVTTDTAITAGFDRRLDPATVDATTAKLTAGATTITAPVSYDDTARTVTLTPSARLNPQTAYTVTLTTGIKALDGTPMGAQVSWSFTTGTDLAVTNRFPAALATGVSPQTVVRAAFNLPVDAATLTSARFHLDTSDGTAVAASIAYDAATQTATLTPSAALAIGATYTATVATGVRSTSGAALDATTSWTFTTASFVPAGPTVTGRSPANGATGVGLNASATATFDIALDPASVTAQTFTLTTGGGAPLAATVSYDAATRTATLAHAASLSPGTVYTVTLTTGIRSSAGAPLAAAATWTFTTADCPCSLMGGLTPAMTGLDVRDGRGGTGPWSYELGTKIAVDATSSLVALRYYKDAAETGTHVGRIWTSTGTPVASVTFANESGSGWQRQALSSPVTLNPGSVYVISVGFNNRFVSTTGGLASQLQSGPLKSVADGANGVFGSAAGTFPTSSYRSSNYFVDGIVTVPGKPSRTPQVQSVTPVTGSSGVKATTTVKATFSQPLDAASVSSSSFTLTAADGTAVTGSVSYDDATQTATFRPSAPLSTSTSYTARLTTAIRSDDEAPLASDYTWSFTTAATSPPVVVGVSPTAGATNVALGLPVTVTFSSSMDPTTVNATNLVLSGPAGAVPRAVTYDDATRTATITPTGPLSGNTTYTVTIGTGVAGSTGLNLEDPYGWTFSTNSCPCKLFADTLAPVSTHLPTKDGRTGTGPFSYEMGVKVKVTSPVQLSAIRFFKDAGETGTHVGRLWTSSGTLVASVTVTGETASGWQQQALASPISLQPGTTYIVSVGFNAFFSSTTRGMESGPTSGPLQSVVDGANGVFGSSAGTFPTGSYKNSNYFVDLVVR
jgi:hypothetical protein